MPRPSNLIVQANGRPMMHGAGATTPYRAASNHPDLRGFNPPQVSEDRAVLRHRNKMAARAHDLVRNDGWASTAVDRWVTSIIGSGWILQSLPDWQALGMDREWAEEFAKTVEAHWRSFSEDPGLHCDYERYTNMAGLFRLLLRHRAIDNEGLGVLQWRKDLGTAKYRTAIQVIDPDRLSTPSGRAEDDLLRMGVELHAQTRAPIAYHMRRSHPGDHLAAAGDTFRWVRVPRETPWGRPMVIHSFDRARAGSTRPASRFAPIIQALRQLTVYDETEVQAAIVNAIFAAYIETPLDPESFAMAFGGGGPAGADFIDKLAASQDDFHEDADLRVNGSRLTHLHPGEKMGTVAAAHPNTVFPEFEQQVLRKIASAMGLSYEQLSNDWSKTNYSSARAALLEVRMGFDSVKERFEAGAANPIYSAFLEELIDDGHVELPTNAPTFREARAAYCRCSWIGAGRGWVDPVKEAQGAQIRMEIGMSTLQKECADAGEDWVEVMHQLKREDDLRQELGLPRAPAFQPTPFQPEEDRNAPSN